MRESPTLLRNRKLRSQHKGTQCVLCGLEPNETRILEVDHIVPLWAGGLDVAGNLQTLCPNCHRLKTIADDLKRSPNRRVLPVLTQEQRLGRALAVQSARAAWAANARLHRRPKPVVVPPTKILDHNPLIGTTAAARWIGISVALLRARVAAGKLLSAQVFPLQFRLQDIFVAAPAMRLKYDPGTRIRRCLVH